MSEWESNDLPAHLPLQALPPVPSGSLQLDIALGGEGIAVGQFVEISGDISTGKTTLCQHIVAQAQRLGRACAWIDADYSFNPRYAERCGVDLSRLYYSSPSSAEQACGILEAIGGTVEGAIVVLDSVNALVSRDEFDLPVGFMTPANPDQQTSEKILSLTLSRLAPKILKSQAIILFTGQPQRQISEAYHQLSSNLARLALKLRASLRLKLHQVGLIWQNETVIGQRVRAAMLKNKNIASHHFVEFDIIYDQGIDHSGEVFDLALQLDLIHPRGEEYVFQGLQLGGGRQRAIASLESQSMIQPIEQVIRRKLLRTLSDVET